MQDVSEVYSAIKKHQFVIDTREVRPILIRVLWAQKFDSFDEAVQFAQEIIKKESERV